MPAEAARLDPDGLGQALIFPYYSARASGDAAFNTYLSISNHAPDAKALRVSFRESLGGAEVAAFNLFLARNDMGAGAVVPHAGGARLVSGDRSCTGRPSRRTSMAVPPPGMPGFITFSNRYYSEAFDDGGGTGLDRALEGWVEVPEMATLVATSLAHATHNSASFPNCGPLRVEPAPSLAAPTGGLAGTLTLIDVKRGLDLTVKAEAIAELSTLPFFRRSGDAYPSFDADEVTPVSVVSSGGVTYRSEWRNGAEAVSAALLRHGAITEYVLDASTRSRTDVVLTFPTRYRRANPAVPAPFSSDFRYRPRCGTGVDEVRRGERVTIAWFDRHAVGGYHLPGTSDGSPSTPQQRICASAAAMPVTNADPPAGSLLASPNQGYSYVEVDVRRPSSSGMLEFMFTRSGFDDSHRMTSLPTSTRLVTATGALLHGAHTFSGLPMVGFMVQLRERHARLRLGACQGNYGGAFPLSYRRSISP